MSNLSRLSTALALLVASQSSQAIIVHFDYSQDTGFFTANPNRQALLQTAGLFFEQHLTDSLSAITSSGGNQFDINFNNPTTGSTTTLSNYSVAADTVVVFVGARALSASILGQGGAGGYSVSATSQAFLDLVSTRGQGDTQNLTDGNAVPAVDVAPWGGSLAFSTSASWYFDSDPTTVESFSGNDFYSVALHELGHLFGIGASDSWDNLVSGTQFTGANAKAANSGANVPLNAAKDHWLEGTQSSYAGSPQEAAMDPTLTVGTRKYLTTLDMAALKDIGWQVSATPVPLPAAAWLFLSGIAGMLLFRRRNLG